MNRKKASIYAAGLLQGIALVAFPASSTILTNPQIYHFTSTQYGSLFIPQALFSILTALLSSVFFKYLGANKTLAVGLTANLFSMVLLVLSVATMRSHELTYCVLMIATSCLGIGFGMVVPTINRMAEVLSPIKSGVAVLILNALLGIGTTLAPLFIAFFSALGFWWGLPLSIVCMLVALILYNLTIVLPDERVVSTTENPKGINSAAFVFVISAFLYGIIETLNGNWISIFMSKQLNSSINFQSLALTSFWGMVTFGRILFALMSKFISENVAFQVAPFISIMAFITIVFLIPGEDYWAVIAFGLSGLGCSVLLPLLISFGGKQLESLAASVPGMIISSYLLGYGVAAFGVGPLKDYGHINLRTIYVIGAIISFVLGLLSLYIVRGEKIPKRRH
jgi:fucose permease